MRGCSSSPQAVVGIVAGEKALGRGGRGADEARALRDGSPGLSFILSSSHPLVAFALPCRPLGLRKCNEDQHTQAQHRVDDNIGRRVGRRGDQARLVESHGVHHVEGEHNARRNAGPAGCSGDGRDHGSIHQIRSSETPVGQLRPSPQHLDDYSSICALLHFLNHRRGELMESVEPEPEERVKYDTQ